MLDILKLIKEAYDKGDLETKIAIKIMFLTDDMISAKDNIKKIQSNLEQHEKSIQEIKRKLKDYEPKKDI